MEKQAVIVAGILRSKPYTVLLTGAGISAESGIPTFRGKNGLWRSYDPRRLATPEAFAENPKLVWEWYSWRMGIIARAQPSRAHEVIAALEREGIVRAVITQNVDGLHQRAGSSNVIELHGNIWRAHCTSCGWATVFKEPPAQLPPRCPRCGGLLRPGVVWFGEPLPEHAWEKAYSEATKAKVMIVVGTSAVVYPAAHLPYAAKNSGAVVVEVNPEATPLTPHADISVRAGAAEFFGLLADRLSLGL